MGLRTGFALRCYLLARHLFQPLMRLVLKRRLQQGREDPARVGEKLGKATVPRPDGRLIWLHAVGIGEVLALRPLIMQLLAADPEVNVLITSTARSSARVLQGNLPPRSQHQFLPLDGPKFVARFLAHWRPDLVIWSEQDLWPGAICDCAAAGIPQAYVNARMGADSYRRRARFRGIYRDILARFALIAAQDEATAGHLRALGAGVVRVTGSLKPAAEPLAADAGDMAALERLLQGRRVWVAASTHPEDEAAVIAAQGQLVREDPAWLLIVTPRVPDRAAGIGESLDAAGLVWVQRSAGGVPEPQTAVWLADSFGELGLWYRLARVAVMGGTFGTVGGHNPWEPLCLGVPVLHGGSVHNFAADYAQIDAAEVAWMVTAEAMPEAIAALADDPDPAPRAAAMIEAARSALVPLARDLSALLRLPR